MPALLVAMRPQQWSKNLLLFAGVLFARRFMEADLLGRAAWGFASFCLLSGAVYLFNDVRDYEADRRHPDKKKRPVASGRLSKDQALVSSGILAGAGLLLSVLLDSRFAVAAAAYLGLNLAYSLYLKHAALLDVFLIAAGFVIRAVAGAFAVNVSISPWLLVLTFLLALFLGFAKRRQEFHLLSGKAAAHRSSLSDYSGPLLDVLISVLAATTIVCYALYSFTSHQPHRMIYSTPFVVYGLFRYLYLIYQKGAGGSPEKVLLRDWPTLINVILWVGVCAYLLSNEANPASPPGVL